MLYAGLDDITYLLSLKNEISEFEKTYKRFIYHVQYEKHIAVLRRWWDQK
jgi:hypothetical protein